MCKSLIHVTSVPAEMAQTSKPQGGSGHQQKGIGTQLLRVTGSISDAAGSLIFIVSSSETLRLYSKPGFQQLGMWTIDNEGWTRRIVVRDCEPGIAGNEHLDEQFLGVPEDERRTVRWLLGTRDRLKRPAPDDYGTAEASFLWNQLSHHSAEHTKG